MGFNADDYAKALEAPSITIGGKTYVGRLPSFDEMLPLAAPLDRITSGDFSFEDIAEFTEELCKLIELPAEKILALPMPVMLAALKDFARSLANTGQGIPTTPKPKPKKKQ
jgi:hypothetical protein